MKRYILLTILLGGLLVACEKTIVLDVDESASVVVIEGLVTDQTSYSYVKLSRSVGFYDTGDTPRITDAIVTVVDNLGTETVFTHNPNNDDDSVGYYLPPSGFVGVVGRTYSLTVEADGEVYTAEDELHRAAPIDSLGYQIDEDEFEDDDRDTDRYYELLLYAPEPQDTEDYYLFNFYRNDSLVTEDDGDVYLISDELLGDRINGVNSPVHFALGDSAAVEIMNLSRLGYIYYSDLSSLLSNDGGLYTPPPANPRTNLSNGALGFFQASGEVRAGLVIE